MSRFDNQIIVITGGTGAIGSSFVKAFVKERAKVVVLGRGKTVPIEKAIDTIKSEIVEDLHPLLWGIACDVSDEKDVASMLQTVEKKWGTPDILINAAGGNKGKSNFIDVDIETFKEVLEMNLLGGLVVPSKLISKLWIDKKMEGTIINVASVASYLPLTGVWAYDASKAGVMNLTAGLANELAQYKIRVNGICPGFYIGHQNRDLLYSDYSKGELSQRGKDVIAHTPFGRFGQVEELNGTLLYLADKSQSGFVTGVTIPVDGGYLINNI
ncbi:SDR family NAD(P)-dependent oxidoreductase [Spirochaeta cellobiosiphila]|uniref:SDR family NAD(P)-dependent oxidoreductase n=1 Tax=Spirochaeta cellobiosiphila TaxID=504483 RepID=UPI0004007F80|nr:SDR family NAD(P)-dependent oxidoreductase [Spirochaeta cellobiosiphila]